jgi:aryl-alcohol dehydrogenase-like predicted oxidoreductase
MRANRLGTTGLLVSDIALGTMTWGRDTDEHEAAEQFELYLASGGFLVDTADVYANGGAQEMVGHLLHSFSADHVVVMSRSGGSTTPGRAFDHSRRHLLESLNTSLTRLGRECLDLWIIHGRDALTPLDELCAIAQQAVHQGKAHYVGICDWPAAWSAAAHRALRASGDVPLTAIQIEYSLVQRGADFDLVDYATTEQIGLVGWAPLGRGVLTGKYRRGTPADSRGASAHLRGYVEQYLDIPSRQVVDAVCAAADGLGVAPLDIALAWVRQQQAFASTVVGARTAAQLRGVLTSLDLELPTEIVGALSDISAVRTVYPQAGI